MLKFSVNPFRPGLEWIEKINLTDDFISVSNRNKNDCLDYG